jgi:hypothetical protein
MGPFHTLLADNWHEVDSLLNPFQAPPIHNEGWRSDLVGSFRQSLGKISPKGSNRHLKPAVGKWLEILGWWLLEVQPLRKII